MIDLLTGLILLGTTFLVGVSTLLVVYARWNYGTLEKKKGLTGVVPPAFLGGSNPRIHKDIICFKDQENAKKYGRIYGYYEGRQAHVYVADSELIRRIFVKDFDCFHNKRFIDFGHPLINDMMDMLRYDRWKVVRSHLSPTLTTGKLRGMSLHMQDAILSWSAKVKKRVESSPGGEMDFDPRQTYVALTADVLARCVFGTKIDALDDPNNPFIINLKKLALDDHEVGAEGPFFATFPVLTLILAKIDVFSLIPNPFFPPELLDYFRSIFKSILKTRLESNNSEKLGDFVDLLNNMIEKTETNEEFKKLKIVEDTFLAQALFFVIAGFETSAVTITLLSYYLSKNQVIQDKLLEEVDAYMQRNGEKIEHDTINELVYLSACVDETLRMHPALIRLERVCNKNWKDERTGLELNEGDIVQVPLYAVHYDEEYFPQPKEFRPERFLPADGKKDSLVPYSFGAFGHGPHNCIGMRFAKEELIMAVVSIMRNFRFEPTTNTQLKFKPGRAFNNNYEPFQLKMCKR